MLASDPRLYGAHGCVYAWCLVIINMCAFPVQCCVDFVYRVWIEYIIVRRKEAYVITVCKHSSYGGLSQYTFKIYYVAQHSKDGICCTWSCTHLHNRYASTRLA